MKCIKHFKNQLKNTFFIKKKFVKFAIAKLKKISSCKIVKFAIPKISTIKKKQVTQNQNFEKEIKKKLYY